MNLLKSEKNHNDPTLRIAIVEIYSLDSIESFFIDLLMVAKKVK